MQLELESPDTRRNVPEPWRAGQEGPASAARPGLACLVLALALAGCQEPPAAGGGGWERPPSPVTVAAVISQDVPVYLDEIGKCVAREVVALEAQVSGRITEIHFTDGAEVKAGEVLFTIDPRPYRAQVDAAAASLAQSKAVLELAKTEMARATDLVNSRSMAKSELDVKRSAVAVAEARIKQDEAALETARLNLDYCTIRAPIDGRVGQRLVDLGNVVSPGDDPMLILQRLDPVYGEFTVAEYNLTAVQQAMAQGRLQVEVRLPEQPEEPRIGELTFLDSAVQTETGTVKLRATIPNADRRFWPGRYVNVRLILRVIPNSVLIPAQASQMSATGPFVYVIKEDSTAELRPVVLGQRQGDLVVVEQGLKAGERVVVTGQIGVMPGGPVRVEEPAAAGAPAVAEGTPAAAEGTPAAGAGAAS